MQVFLYPSRVTLLQYFLEIFAHSVLISYAEKHIWYRLFRTRVVLKGDIFLVWMASAGGLVLSSKVRLA
jgi:hypothetical protein